MPNSIFKYIIFIFIACIPLVHWNEIIDTTMLSRQIWLSAFCLLAAIMLLIDNVKKITLSPLHYLLIALPLLSLLSYTYTQNTSETIYTTCKFLLTACLFFTVTTLLQSNKITLLNISQAVSVFTLIACGYQIYELVEKGNLNLLKGKNLYELNSLFGHKNLFSSIMFLCIPFIFFLIITSQNYLKYLYGLLLFLLLGILIFIQTKAVLLAIILGTGVGILVLFNTLNLAAKIKYGSMATFALVTIFFIFLLKNKLTLLSSNDTIIERSLLWQNTWQMIKENPIFGVGAGNWQIFFPKYGLQNFMQTNYLISDGYTTFQRPHNDFLWIWSEIGISGFVIYVSIFGLTIYQAIQNIKFAELTKDKVIATGFLAGIIGYVFIAFVDFPIERSEHQLLVIIIIAVIFSKKIKPFKKPVFSSKVVCVILIMATLFNLNIFINRANGETHALKMLVAHTKNNWSLMEKEAQKAINKYYTIDNFSIPLKWYAGVAFSALGNNAEAKLAFNEAYLINPYQIHVLNNIASISEMEGNHDLALKYYNEALAISPFQPDALLNKSAVLFNKNNLAEAFTNILKFKFDATNTQFKNYYLTIAKAKLNDDLLNNKTSLTKPWLKPNNIINDTFLLKNFENFKNNSLTLY
jgi:O-antigen ligase/Tfp pilus assembly protein PilF